MTDPATNALALQMEYGDEELKKQIDDAIRTVVQEELIKLFNNPQFGERFITNNAWALQRQIKSSIKDMVSQINVY